MLAIYTFATLSIILVLFALMIFKSKNLINAILSLTGVFFMSSMILFFLGQALVALLQLIILVGGLSTYLIVAVASEPSKDKKVHVWAFTLVFAVLFVILVPLAISIGNGYYLSAGSGNFVLAAANDFSTYPYLFFVIALLVAASAIGSVAVIRKIVKLVA